MAATETETHSPLYTTLRHLEADNAALRLKLARHEFRQLERELKSEQPFALNIDAAGAPVTTGLTLPALGGASLPPLPVPLGSIHAHETATDLPVIGVYDEGLIGANLAAALLGLLSTQYHSPFARLLFLCSSFEAVPFLARYGFAVEQIGTNRPDALLERFHGRYGVRQIRALGSGAVIATWPQG